MLHQHGIPSPLVDLPARMSYAGVPLALAQQRQPVHHGRSMLVPLQRALSLRCGALVPMPQALNAQPMTGIKPLLTSCVSIMTQLAPMPPRPHSLHGATIPTLRQSRAHSQARLLARLSSTDTPRTHQVPAISKAPFMVMTRQPIRQQAMRVPRSRSPRGQRALSLQVRRHG